MRSRMLLLCALVALPIRAAACSSAYVQPPAPSVSVPALKTGGTNASAATVAPVGSSVQPDSVSVIASQAPLCSATASCAALDGEQIPLGCVKKVPYTNVLVPKGTTFEVLDRTGDFSCADSGVVLNDMEVLTCHGKQLYAFQLKLTNSACNGAVPATGTGQCQEGYGYDSSAKCCAPVTGGSAGSTTVTVNLGACP